MAMSWPVAPRYIQYDTMNIFNRVALLITAIAVIVISALVAAVAAGGLSTATLPLNPWLPERLAPFAGLTGSSAVTAFAVCAVLILLALGIAIAEVVTLRPSRSQLTLLEDSSGLV